MTGCVYEDEHGAELWASPIDEYVPPGTLITSPDGDRYLAVQASATQVLDGPSEAALRITLRPTP